MASSDKVKGQIDTVPVETLRSGAFPHAFADEAETDPVTVGGEFDDSEPTRAEQPAFAGADDTRANEVGDLDDSEPTRAG